MSILDRLLTVPGVFWGEGGGPQTGAYVARVQVTVLGDDDVRLDYEAWSRDKGLRHAESTRIHRAGDEVLVESEVDGAEDVLRFREGEPGVFGSLGAHRVGMILELGRGRAARSLTWSWWWATPGQPVREQSRAELKRVRRGELFGDKPAPESEAPAPQPEPPAAPAEPVRPSPAVPWPGVVVLPGGATAGAVARQVAARLPRAALVRSDLFDRAVRGTEAPGGPDPELRHGIAADVVLGYARSGYAVVVHESGDSPDGPGLVQALHERADLPVHLVDVDRGTGDSAAVAVSLLVSLPAPTIDVDRPRQVDLNAGGSAEAGRR